MDNELVIRCPVCGQAYLPAEIYLPDDSLGKPHDIVKTTDGKIDFYFGQKQDLDADYICDNCSSHFKVHANISFTTSAVTQGIEEHVTHFNRAKKLQLEEQLFND